MRDAIGGSVTLFIISVFIVLALGYLAFNVNYTKAFRMKDKIISLYEDYDGNCHNVPSCQDAILKYANTLGYSNDKNLKCENLGTGYHYDANGLYCYKEVMVQRESKNASADHIVRDLKDKHYYKIVTKINLQIPIISNVFDFSFFYIYGDTKSFEI